MANPQIIIVEDELIIAQEIKQFLLKMNYSIPATATSGEDALRKIALIKPDLVLMDIKLKGEMNGIEAAGKAHALYDVPVVYMTANADPDTVEKAKKTEAYGFVYKPVQPDVLRAVIEMALYKHNMERQVKEREAWLAATLQSIGDAVIATDTQGNITFMNGVAETLTGWLQQECKTKPLQDVFHIINKKTRKQIASPVTIALTDGQRVGLANDTILIARDGKEYQIADSASPILNTRGDVIGVVLVFRDVTDEYRMREEIQQNEQKYRNLFDYNSSGVAVYEGIDNGNDFIFKDFNRAGEKIEQIKKDQVIGQRVSKVFPGVVEFGLMDVLRRVWQTGKPEHHPISIYKDNKIASWRKNYVYKLQSGEVVAVYDDVTESMKADERLHASEENLRITLNSIGDAVIATDIKGKIIRMNPVAEELTGWKFDEVKGKPLNQVFHIINSQTRKKADNPVEQVLATGKIVGLANHTALIAKNKVEYQIADSGAPIKDANGNITGVVLVFRDVTEEYRIREKILKSEKKYAELFNSSINGIALHEIVLDETGQPIDYIFLEANAIFEKLTGLKVEDIIGKRVTEVIPGIEKTTFISQYGHVALTGETLSFQQFAPGIDKYFNINAFSPRKGQFATVFSDITETKQTEQELLTERQRLADILKGTNVGTWEWNVQSGETSYDERWAEMVGYSLEELSPISIKTWEKLIHPDDLQVANETLNNHFNGTSDYYECEARLHHKNGSWIWILDRGRVTTWADDGKPLLMYGTHQDITGRKRMEEALRENEEKYRLLHENAGVGISYYRLDGTVISYNRIASNNMRGLPEDFNGKSIFEIFPQKEAEFYYNRIKKAALSDIPVVYEDLVPLPSGNQYFLSTFTKITDLNNNISGIQIISQDITERKQAEEQIRKNLQEKEVMLKEIHHRVKNNMNVITSLLHLQAKRIETKEQALAAFEESRNRIFSMALVHEQLYKSDDLSRINMKNYIELISHKLKQVNAFEKNISIEMQVNNVFLDVTHAIPCGLILNELITNVFKHAFSNRSEGRVIITFNTVADNTFELKVQDNGVGLPENIDAHTVGTLGLQLVKLLTDQIGGSLKIERNEGTAFIIRFMVTNRDKK